MPLFSTGWFAPSGTLSGKRGENVIAWGSPSNIKFKDGVSSTASFAIASGYSEYLYANDFHFAIPDGATIEGVRFGYNRHYTGAVGNISDNRVQLLIDGTGTLYGSNYANPSGWPTTSSGLLYGGTGNLWGLTAAELNSTNINGSGFGVVIQAKASANGLTANVDNVSGEIWYSTTSVTGINSNLPFFLPSQDSGSQGLPLVIGLPVHCTDWLPPQSGFSHYFGNLGPQAYWSNPNNITVDDNSFANIVTTNEIAFTNFLTGDNFNFNVPDNATIVGFTLGLKRYALSGNNTLSDWDMYILAPGTGDASQAFHFGGQQLWPTGQESIHYGADNNLWGVNLTPDIVNASDFGFGLQVYRNFSFDEARVVYASGQICYTVPDSFTSGLPLFTQGSQQTGINDSLPLFMWGNEGFPLFVAGHLSDSGNAPLYIGGHITVSSGIPLYILAEASFGQSPLYTHGHADASGIFPLYLKTLDLSDTGGSGSLSLFTKGKSGLFEELSTNLPLFLQNEGYDGSIPLYLSVDSIGRPTYNIPLYIDSQSYEGGVGYIPLFIATQSGFNGDVPLFIEGLRFGDNASPGDGWYQATGSLPLYISRQLLFDSNLPFFLAQNEGSGNNSITLYQQGVVGSNSSGLPLVIYQSVINSNKIVPLYTSGF